MNGMQGCVYGMGGGAVGLSLGLGIPSVLLVWMGQSAWESAGPLTGEVSDVANSFLLLFGVGIGSLGGLGLQVSAGLALLGLFLGFVGLAVRGR